LFLTKYITVVMIAVVLNFFVVDESNAAGINIWCQVRGVERSKVNIKGRGLPRGRYFAKIYSGGVWVQSGVKAAAKRQVEFEFDSHDEEDEPGGKNISPTFIQDLKVLGLIREAKSKRLVGKMSGSCEFRDR
jgi:hypothetical protein